MKRAETIQKMGPKLFHDLSRNFHGSFMFLIEDFLKKGPLQYSRPAAYNKIYSAFIRFESSLTTIENLSADEKIMFYLFLQFKKIIKTHSKSSPSKILVIFKDYYLADDFDFIGKQ